MVLQVGAKHLVLDEVSPQQGVYIYNCKDCVVRVSGAHQRDAALDKQ
jgi:hypothetical protein